MDYLGNEDCIPAKHWRIRHGIQDSDTAIAIPAILALKLEQLDYNVDFKVPWGQGHGGDYDLEELFDWMEDL